MKNVRVVGIFNCCIMIIGYFNEMYEDIDVSVRFLVDYVDDIERIMLNCLVIMVGIFIVC